MGWGTSVGICKKGQGPYPESSFLQILQDGTLGIYKGNTIRNPETRILRNFKDGDILRLELDLGYAPALAFVVIFALFVP